MDTDYDIVCACFAHAHSGPYLSLGSLCYPQCNFRTLEAVDKSYPIFSFHRFFALINKEKEAYACTFISSAFEVRPFLVMSKR